MSPILFSPCGRFELAFEFSLSIENAWTGFYASLLLYLSSDLSEESIFVGQNASESYNSSSISGVAGLIQLLPASMTKTFDLNVPGYRKLYYPLKAVSGFGPVL